MCGSKSANAEKGFEMNISPINYQQMSVNQGVNRQNSKNVKQQYSTVNFTGYVAKNLERYVEEYAQYKFKGDTKAAQEYAEQTLNIIKEEMKKYHPDVYVDRRQYIYEPTSKVVGDLWIFGYRTLPSSLYEVSANAKNDNDGIDTLEIALTPRYHEQDLINTLAYQARLNLPQGKGNAELLDAIDKLAMHIKDKKHYKDNYVNVLKKSSDDVRENISIGKIESTEENHIKQVYENNKILAIDPEDGNYYTHHGDVLWEHRIKFVPGYTPNYM